MAACTLQLHGLERKWNHFLPRPCSIRLHPSMGMSQISWQTGNSYSTPKEVEKKTGRQLFPSYASRGFIIHRGFVLTSISVQTKKRNINFQILLKFLKVFFISLSVTCYSIHCMLSRLYTVCVNITLVHPYLAGIHVHVCSCRDHVMALWNIVTFTKPIGSHCTLHVCCKLNQFINNRTIHCRRKKYIETK